MSIYARIDAGKVAEVLREGDLVAFAEDVEIVPVPDAFLQVINTTDFKFVNDEVLPADKDTLVRLLKERVSARRKAEENRGVEVGGMEVPSDSGTQNKLAAAVASFNDGDIEEGETISFINNGSSIELNEMQVKAIKRAIVQHVQACYRRQGAIYDLLDIQAGEIEETMEGYTTLVTLFRAEVGTGW